MKAVFEEAVQDISGDSTIVLPELEVTVAEGSTVVTYTFPGDLRSFTDDADFTSTYESAIEANAELNNVVNERNFVTSHNDFFVLKIEFEWNLDQALTQALVSSNCNDFFFNLCISIIILSHYKFYESPYTGDRENSVTLYWWLQEVQLFRNVELCYFFFRILKGKRIIMRKR